MDNLVKLESLVNDVATRSYLRKLSGYKVKSIDGTNEGSPKNNKNGVCWFRITKIVMEKDVFFADKLSMLYTSLHGMAKTVVLALHKDKGAVELYLGARDFSSDTTISKKILENGLRGFLPGVAFEKCDFPKYNQQKGDKTTVSSVSVIASLIDDKKEHFTQGIEKLINASSSIPRYTAYFIAENIKEEEANSMIQAFGEINTQLSPYAEIQTTISESHTDGVSESLTKSFAETVTENISKTITHGNGWNLAGTKSGGESDGINANFTPFGIGVGYNNNSQSGWSNQIGFNGSFSKAIQQGVSQSEQSGIQKQNGESHNDTKGTSFQIIQKNSHIKRHMDLIDKQVERLQNGIPFGLWSVATYFIAPLNTTAIELANIYKGCVVGEESNQNASAINYWDWKDSDKKNDTLEILKYLDNIEHPQFIFDGLGDHITPGSIVTSKELAIHLSLPQSSVPGILVREEPSFGRNVPKQFEKNSIYMGNVMFLGQEDKKNEVRIDIDSLAKHTFITGTTGSGKSYTMYMILEELMKKGKKILVIEPTKGEYKKVFGTRKGMKVYGSNPNKSPLLRINPFEFPQNTHVYEHIDRLVDIFNACWPMYAAMPVILKKAITDAYERCGWNLSKSDWGNSLNGQTPLFPTVSDVVALLRDFINKSEYSPDTKGDYKGSLETRLMSLAEGLNGLMLNNSENNLANEELFNKNVIVDLSLVGSSETRSLIMGLLIMKLNEYRLSEGKMNSKLQHITVLEEAHCLLKRTDKSQSQESSNLAGKSVEMLCNCISEMRTFGEGFVIVDQSPAQVDLAAIRNTNTKIIMSLPEKDDKITAGKSIGLTDAQIEEIGRQKVRQAIVYQNEWEEPVQCLMKEHNIKPLEYSKKDSSIDANTLSQEALCSVIQFLFDICSEKQIEEQNVEKIRESVRKTVLKSSIKYDVLKLLEDYQNNGIKLTKVNHTTIMELTALCIGKQEKIASIIAVRKNVDEINDTIIEVLMDVFPNKNPNDEMEFYRFCVRSMLRLEVSKKPEMVKIYNNWIKKNY